MFRLCVVMDNTYKNSNGCWIRSELWACLAPGHPEIATRYAFEDAIVDHANEGMYGEIFTAALQSAAFAESDREKLIDIGLSYIPEDCLIKPETDYLHITTNNTIYGTEYWKFPEVDIPIICDMSSDILSRRIDFNRFDMIWAGIQKNLGAAGMALVILKKDFAKMARTDIPPFRQYKIKGMP